jgi:hypothetical protein
MKITKEQAIKLLDYGVPTSYLWIQNCADIGLYELKNGGVEDFPTFLEVLEALGVSKEEYKKAVECR